MRRFVTGDASIDGEFYGDLCLSVHVKPWCYMSHFKALTLDHLLYATCKFNGANLTCIYIFFRGLLLNA